MGSGAIRFLALLSTLALAAAGPASALPVDLPAQTLGFDLIGASFINEKLAFSKFDASQGPLLAVKIELASDLSSTVGIVADGVSGPFSIQGTQPLTLTVIYPGDNRVGNVQGFATCSDSGIKRVYGCLVTATTTAAFDFTALLDSSEFPNVSGAGTFDVDLFFIPTFLGFCSAPCAVGDFAFTLSNEWNGQLSVTYTYEASPVDVPAPSSLTLLALAIAALGATRRTVLARRGSQPSRMLAPASNA